MKTTQSKARQIFLALAALHLFFSPNTSFAANAPISWVGSSITAATDVSTAGTLTMAYTMSIVGALTINTVPFAADPNTSDFDGTTVYTGNGVTDTVVGPTGNDNGANPANYNLVAGTYEQSLHGLKFSASSWTMTLTGLTTGHIYVFQIWMGYYGNSLATSVSDGVGNTTNLNCIAGGKNIGTGTFTANSATETITGTSASGSSFDFTMFQLRDLGAACTSPTAFGVTGGTNCNSASIGLNNAQTGVTYQILTNGVSIGVTGSTNPVASGTIDFGLFTNAATYTIQGTNNAGGCSTTMTNNVVIMASPVGGTSTPTSALVCNGSGTTIALTGQTGNIQWQSRTGANAFANIGGANSTPLNTGNLTATTDFRAVLTNLACADALSTTSTVTVVAVPPAFNVTGGTNCSGNGVDVGLSGSVSGVTYQLFTNGVSTGTAGSQSGNGSALDFGLQTAVATCTIWATNGTGCSAQMSNSAQVYALTANVSGNATIRKGATALITNTLSGLGPFNVTWSDGVTSNGVNSPLVRIISPASTTTYTITNLTDASCNTNGGFSGGAVITVVGSAYKIKSAAGSAAFSVAAGVSTNVTITLVDSSGNTASTFNGTVNLTFSGLNASAGGVVPIINGTNLGTATPLTFASGAVTVPLIGYKFETATLSATDDGSPALTTATTGGATAAVTVTGTPGTVTKLVWATQPGSAVYGSPFGMQPVLMTVDQSGNASTSGLPATLTVTVSLTGGTGPLQGTTSYNIGTSGSNGVVTFGNLQINAAGTNKQLTASVPAGYGSPVAGMAVWLDGSDTNTITGSNPVTSWNNKGTNINGNFNTTVGGAGTIRSGLDTLNGRNVILFPGTSGATGRGLRGNATNTSSAVTVFALVKMTTAQNSFQRICGFASGSGNDFNVAGSFDVNINSATAKTERNSVVAGGGSIPAQGTPWLQEAIWNGANSQIAAIVKSGAARTSGNATFNNLGFTYTHGTIGAGDTGAGGNDPWGGDIAEFIVYAWSLSAPDLSTVETYLSNKWFSASYSNINYSSISPAVSATFTVAKASSSSAVASSFNPSSFGASVTFTNTVTGVTVPTGNVIFYANGSSLATIALNGSGIATTTTSSLARGLYTITAEYAGDLNFSGVTNNLSGGQVVSNSPPVAVLDTFARSMGISMKIPISALLANDTDQDGDSPQFVGVSGTTTNGGTLTTDGTSIFVPAATVNDAFTYTIQDGNSGTNTGNVFIILVGSSGQVTTVSPTPSNAMAIFFGIPDRSYTVQRATNIGFTLGLSNFPSITAPSNGVFSVTDGFEDLGGMAPGSAFYRLLIP